MPRTTTRTGRPRRTAPLGIEQLEDRVVPAAGVGIFDPVNDAFLLRNTVTPGAADERFRFVTPGGCPVVGDWNGDGKDGIGIYNPAVGGWRLRQTADAGAADAGLFVFGPAGGMPVAGDWNGDGTRSARRRRT